MKTDLLFTRDGLQFIMTPEDDFEKAALKAFGDYTVADVKTGPVWARTVGGFYREFDERPNTVSTMIVLRKPEGK